jgi:hypothetical protein
LYEERQARKEAKAILEAEAERLEKEKKLKEKAKQSN